MLNLILNTLYHCKAKNIEIFKSKNLIFEDIILTTGLSNTHINSICNKIVLNVKIFMKKNYILVSGKKTEWIIIDMDTIILNVMSDELRKYYDLDSFYKNEYKL
jgi:ribosome-associated protein